MASEEDNSEDGDMSGDDDEMGDVGDNDGESGDNRRDRKN